MDTMELNYNMDILSLKNINPLMKTGDFFITILDGQLVEKLSNTPESITAVCDNSFDNNFISRNFKKIKTEKKHKSKPGYLLTLKSSEKEQVDLHINNINTAQCPQKQNLHNRFILEKNTSVNIIEQTFFLDNTNLIHAHDTVSEWFVCDNASLCYYSFGPTNNHMHSTQNNSCFIHQKQNSNCSFFTFYWGMGKTTNSIQAHLIEKNISCWLHSISLLKGSSFVSNDVTVTHHSSNCESSQDYKGIYDDESRGIFNGNILVKTNAQKTNAFQNNNNILLSDYASIQSNPQLEIFADDVKCSHGSTTGQLDEAALFYLRSRGYSKSLANSVLLQAFLTSVTNNIQHEELKKSVILKLTKKLGVN